MSRWGLSCAWEMIDGRIRQEAGCRRGHAVSYELSGYGLGVSEENMYFETTFFPLFHTALLASCSFANLFRRISKNSSSIISNVKQNLTSKMEVKNSIHAKDV